MSNVAQTFQIGPHDAHQELGGRPLRPRERRRLTLHVLDAARAQSLEREFKGTGGKEDAVNALQWTEHDQRFYRELRDAGGYVQPPLRQ